MNDLKEAIEEYYQNERDLDGIRNKIYCELISNGFLVPDIDKLLIHMLRTPDHYKFKLYILNKQGNKVKCGVCGIKKDLELHHLKKVSKYPELVYDENNVVFLCRSCHSLIHYGGGEKLKEPLKKKIKIVFKHELNRNRNKKILKEVSV